MHGNKTKKLKSNKRILTAIMDRNQNLNTTIKRIKNHKYIISTLLLTYIISFIFYFKALFTTGSLDFPDLGVFSIFPSQSLTGYIFDWQLGGYGSQGSVLPYSLILYSLEAIFHNPGITEKIWLLSLLPIGSLFIYYISNIKLKIGYFYSFVFAYLYAFNPITAGLFYRGSVNDTLTMYIFEPILVILVLLLLSSFNYSDVLKWVTIFILLYFYVSSWSGEIVMWILPIFFVAFIFKIIYSYKHFRNIQPALIGAFLVIFGILLTTGEFEIILTVFTGRGSQTFSVAAGTSNITDLIIDFHDNVYGQLSYIYAVLSTFLVGVSIYLFAKLKSYFSNEEKSLYLSMLTIIILIIFVWTSFRFSIKFFETVIASYVPELAAYEPFMGITLIFSLFFMQMLFLWKAFNNYLDNNHPSVFKSVRNFIRSKSRYIRFFLIILVIIILMTSSVGYGREHDVPNATTQLLNSDSSFNLYKVPFYETNLSSYLSSHLQSSEGRYLLLPYSGLSSEAVEKFIPEIGCAKLTPSLWSDILNANNDSSSYLKFSQELAVLGIEYVVINKGPYVSGSGNGSTTGQARFYAAGFPWDLSYLPAGNWTNWFSILGKDPYLDSMSNTSNYIIFKNPYFTGIFHEYILPKNFSINSIVSTSSNGSLLYPDLATLKSPTFNIPHGPFSENWSIINTLHGICYVGSTLPSNMTYSNIYSKIDLIPCTNYVLNYSIAGKNMADSSIYIRFYSGENCTGKVVNTYSSPEVTGNNTFHLVNYTFQTPEIFKSASIFLTYHDNNHVTNYSSYFYINYLVHLKTTFPLPISSSEYHFVNPTKTTINVNVPSNHSILLLYSSTFDTGWNIYSKNTNIKSTEFVISQSIIFNSFYITKSISNATLEFEPQKTHSMEILIEWSILISTGVLLAALLILPNLKRKRHD